jgi:hypothetical protein
MDPGVKTSSIDLDFAFTEDFTPILICGDHPLEQEITDLVSLRMRSDDLVIDSDLFPSPQDYLDHAWTTCLGTLQHYFPEVEFVRMGIDGSLPEMP